MKPITFTHKDKEYRLGFNRFTAAGIDLRRLADMGMEMSNEILIRSFERFHPDMDRVAIMELINEYDDEHLGEDIEGPADWIAALVEQMTDFFTPRSAIAGNEKVSTPTAGPQTKTK